MIARVEAYKTPSGMIKLEVEQKIPILRVISPRGNYYVDNLGSTMPVSRRYVAHVPVVSGYVEKELAVTDLYKFALFLQENDFWNNQIEQIYVHPDNEVELIPRVGNHRIVLGSFADFEEKLDNLRLFYEKAIPKVGWEKYSIISLKYKDQIVCTKDREYGIHRLYSGHRPWLFSHGRYGRRERPCRDTFHHCLRSGELRYLYTKRMCI